jgi:hypothetical protein
LYHGVTGKKIDVINLDEVKPPPFKSTWNISESWNSTFGTPCLFL